MTALRSQPLARNGSLATTALDPTGRHVLTQARKNLRERLSRQRIDAYEANLALPRSLYRTTVLFEEIDALDGTAAEYANAFGAANGLIDHATSDIMGRLACYPMSAFMPAELEVLKPGTPMVIEFVDTNQLAWLLSPGEIGWVNDDLVRDAVVINGMKMSFSGTGTGSIRLTAETLPGTGDAWQRLGC